MHIVEFNKSTEAPFICIHGWMDNWSSFLPLSKHLDTHLICIDLPGHGKSSHLPEGNWYHFVDYAVRLREIINKLKISKFHIIGHSMGAAIGCLYSASFPESLLSLTMIDGLGPLINPSSEARNILRESILEREKIKKKKRSFTNLDLAIKARMSNGGISYNSAKILVKNQVTKIENNLEWTFDYKLKSVSSLRLNKEQLFSFFENLKCPSLLIIASEGYVRHAPFWPERNKIKNLETEKIHGTHHLHMESPSEVAHSINNFTYKL